MSAPRFENDLPGRPLGAGSEDEGAAPAPTADPEPDSAPAPAGADGNPTAAAPSPEDAVLTDEESAAISGKLYAPTVRRMCVVGRNLVQVTGNGDLAFWAPMAVMDELLHGLMWDRQQPMVAERLLLLVILTMREYANRLNTHLLAVTQFRGTGSQGNMPTMPVWTTDDTRAMYAEVAKTFGDLMPVAPAGPDPEIMETLQALGGAAGFLPSAFVRDPDVLERLIETWTPTQRRQARAWALRAQLAQVEGADVPTMPEFIHE
jgi:hypothetical protein